MKYYLNIASLLFFTVQNNHAKSRKNLLPAVHAHASHALWDVIQKQWAVYRAPGEVMKYEPGDPEK